MNLQSSTLKWDESGEPLHIQQAKQIAIFREAWAEAGHAREPRVSVSRSIFPLVDERDWAYFGVGRQDRDQIGYIDENTRAVFGRTYAAEPDKPGRGAEEGRGDRRRRHAPPDDPEPAWGRIQRPRAGGHRQLRRPRARLAVIAGLPGISSCR